MKKVTSRVFTVHQKESLKWCASYPWCFSCSLYHYRSSCCPLDIDITFWDMVCWSVAVLLIQLLFDNASKYCLCDFFSIWSSRRAIWHSFGDNDISFSLPILFTHGFLSLYWWFLKSNMVFFDDVQALKWPRSEWYHSGGNPMHNYAKASSSFSCHGGSAALEQGSFSPLPERPS